MSYDDVAQARVQDVPIFYQYDSNERTGMRYQRQSYLMLDK